MTYSTMRKSPTRRPPAKGVGISIARLSMYETIPLIRIGENVLKKMDWEIGLPVAIEICRGKAYGWLNITYDPGGEMAIKSQAGGRAGYLRPRGLIPDLLHYATRGIETCAIHTDTGTGTLRIRIPPDMMAKVKGGTRR